MDQARQGRLHAGVRCLRGQGRQPQGAEEPLPGDRSRGSIPKERANAERGRLVDGDRDHEGQSRQQRKVKAEQAPTRRIDREEQKRRLQGYGWVQRERGTVHIPIDRAIDLYVSEHAP